MERLVAWERIAAALLALGLAGNAAFFFLVVQPLAEAQRGQDQRLLTLQTHIRRLHGQGRALGAQIKTLGEVEAYREQFPERSGVARVGEELARVARGLNLKMPGITYQPEPVKDADLLRIRLSLAVEGEYGQVRRFLHELEKRRRYLVVERIGLSEQRGQARGSQVAMQLSLAGYFR